MSPPRPTPPSGETLRLPDTVPAATPDPSTDDVLTLGLRFVDGDDATVIWRHGRAESTTSARGQRLPVEHAAAYGTPTAAAVGLVEYPHKNVAPLASITIDDAHREAALRHAALCESLLWLITEPSPAGPVYKYVSLHHVFLDLLPHARLALGMPRNPLFR